MLLMLDHKKVGWFAFAMMTVAGGLAGLALFGPWLTSTGHVFPYLPVLVLIAAAGLLATVAGMYSRRTPAGKVAALGGLLILVAVGGIIVFSCVLLHMLFRAG